MAVPGGMPLIKYDLAWSGQILSRVSNTSYVVNVAAGMPTGKLIGYFFSILRHGSAGAAPQLEKQRITAQSINGTIDIVLPFTTEPNVGDEVLLLHPSVASGSFNLDTTGITTPYVQPNDILEHTVFTLTGAMQQVDTDFDVFNLTQNNTFREYIAIDGTNYRCVSAKVFPNDFDTGAVVVAASMVQKNYGYRITMQAAGLEGATRNVPYRQIRKPI